MTWQRGPITWHSRQSTDDSQNIVNGHPSINSSGSGCLTLQCGTSSFYLLLAKPHRVTPNYTDREKPVYNAKCI